MAGTGLNAPGICGPVSQAVARLVSDPRYATLRRSFEVYHGADVRHDAMDTLYGDFVGEGDLAFDIGSHVGDRVASFRRLGARVVALEPQELCRESLEAIFALDKGVTIVGAACGAMPGSIDFLVNSQNPTVSSAAADFISAAKDADGWREQVWDKTVTVPVVTLDDLIARYGMPAFVKIDVEGFEAEVLSGLTHALPALSFEFTTIQRDVAEACLARLTSLGRYRFNLAIGESQKLSLPDWIDAAAMADVIRELPHSANSGDVYGVLEDEI